jgi:hypothetical protein
MKVIRGASCTGTASRNPGACFCIRTGSCRTSTRLRSAALTPYYELGGGIQYAAGTPFPAHGSRWMFTINAGVGALIPLKPTLQINTAIRYLHISNAGLWSDNAGYDAFHVFVGVRW